ncbi:MAG: 50S ribosomal protein L25, partial [Planctomycetes bacterium]|nr:50S ribosomal protein L25 [Planctomycetota bacterium]
HGEPTQSFYVRHEQIARHVAAEQHLMTITIGDKKESGLLKELQFDTFGEKIIHVDFARVSMDEVIETSIPVHTVGTARGVSSGGILDLPHHEVLVRGTARAIPAFIEVEVGHLGIGDAIRVRELQLPQGVVALIGPEEPVVIVHGHTPDEEATGAEGEAGA